MEVLGPYTVDGFMHIFLDVFIDYLSNVLIIPSIRMVEAKIRRACYRDTTTWRSTYAQPPMTSEAHNPARECCGVSVSYSHARDALKGPVIGSTTL